jgi:membrane-bound lytic murein transglycosylase D
VRAGETLGQLAQRYRTTTAVLSEVNSLTGNLIRIGQPLMIPHAVNDLNAYTQSVEARLERRQNQARDGQRQTHDVRPGESLWSISQAYGVGVRELAVWNGMAPGDVLSVGRQLVIWSDRVTAVPASNERIRRINYIVRKGDSLSRISTRFRVSVTELLKWNEIATDQYLQPGQRLLLYVDVTEQTS